MPVSLDRRRFGGSRDRRVRPSPTHYLGDCLRVSLPRDWIMNITCRRKITRRVDFIQEAIIARRAFNDRRFRRELFTRD